MILIYYEIIYVLKIFYEKYITKFLFRQYTLKKFKLNILTNTINVFILCNFKAQYFN